VPKYPTADPDYRILSRQRCRYTHYYFYIRDEVLGPVALCVGSFLPFAITYYLNGHNVIERELRRAGLEFARSSADAALRSGRLIGSAWDSARASEGSQVEPTDTRIEADAIRAGSVRALRKR
jgi:hypothetical protein